MARYRLKEFNVKEKQIYRTIVEFVDGQGEKERPVIIVAVDEDIFIAISLKITKTGVDPKKRRLWDRYKVPVLNWRKAGLTHPSFVECSRIIRIDANALVEYIGEMHEYDFQRVYDEFEGYLQEDVETTTYTLLEGEK